MTRGFAFLALAAAAWAQPVFNVRDYGAAGDGKRKDTSAIARAIGACSKAGGGTVYFPAGRYLTGAITLASHLRLEVGPGAVILGSEDPADYPLRKSPWPTYAEEISALIYGENLVNVTLAGRGTIDGQGREWWRRQWLATAKKGRQADIAGMDPAEGKKVAHGRPHLIKIVRSKNVWIEGLTMLNSPSWTVNPVFCEFVTVRGITIHNPVPSPNTDGINPESCRNVHISDSNIDVGDDCITLKSGKDEAGRRVGIPCENITVTNCTMMKGHGGVVIGSEMSGGVRNVVVSNCVFQGTDKGIRIKSQRGRGGVVEGVSVSNIVMQNVPEAFTITTFYQGSDTPGEIHAVGDGTPRFRDIRIGNVTARGSKSAGQITGLREMPISGITFSNVRIQAETGFSIQNARDIAFRDVEIEVAKGPGIFGSFVESLELVRLRAPQPDLKNTTFVK
jgi:polygalacturonase